jgi:hypothetical protein
MEQSSEISNSYCEIPEQFLNKFMHTISYSIDEDSGSGVLEKLSLFQK